MKSTGERLEFGDTIEMEFMKEENGVVQKEKLCTTFTPAVVDSLLKNNIIEKVSRKKDILRQIEEDSFNAVFDNLDVLNEKLKKQEQLLNKLLTKSQHILGKINTLSSNIFKNKKKNANSERAE